ncbi:serine/threonine-protein kinase PLK1 isoform X2 [Nematostella vectensis]|uniref:serine/threonine-protein kinase PLK1 isoform X2 n=1 Tax=Nematostella vectensis TaxID=45351 RepID=UPI0013902421|nr:serine/threonine-protein kinase PLK1 isoform X2 [Nematostella vectensis]
MVAQIQLHCTGGFARVYEVTDMSTNKIYALKVVPKKRLSKSTKEYRKIEMEIELHRTLRHHYVVGFHGSFQDEMNFYILLELCSRKSLVQMLKTRGKLTEPEVRFFMQQAIEACSYLHEQRVIHRDIKVGNFFINSNMELRLGDFGLAVRLKPDEYKIRTMCGTPNYIAPEVLSKEGHSYEVDTWALGCVMYTMLVGHPPFETKSLRETYRRIRNNDYTIPSRVSDSAARLIQRMLHANPENRPKLSDIFSDDFFAKGFLPNELPLTCLCGTPKWSDYEKRSTADSKKEHVLLSQALNRKLRINADEKEEQEQKVPISSDKRYINGHAKDENETVKNGNMNLDNSQKYFSPEGLYVHLSTCLQHLEHSYQDKSNDMCNTKLQGVAKPLLSRDDAKNHQNNKDREEFAEVFIAKWVDYSNKYGFGAQLSDGCVTVRFNDCSKIALASDKRSICYRDEDQPLLRFSTSYVPSNLHSKVTLLTYFANYMDKHLLKGGDPADVIPSHPDSIPFIDIWFRTDITMVMYLSNGAMQVNFFKDHTKVVLIPGEDNALFIYINEHRESTSRLLSELNQDTVSWEVIGRLIYCKQVLRKVMEVIADEENNHL